MRLIDADALIKTMNEDYIFYGFADLLKDIHAMIDEAPTIDAVSVVRCKECKYAEIYKGQIYDDVNCINGVIGGYGAHLELDDFCSYGEKGEPDIYE